MGLVKAVKGAVGGTLADQWKDFLTVPSDIWPSAAVFPAVRVGTNAARGSNTSGSIGIVSNGSKIVVPEGYGLLLFQEGQLTGFTNEPGGYTWTSDSSYSQTIFANDSVADSLVRQSWERFKFGGIPGAQQLALFVRTAELPNNRFGTQSPIYWDDTYLKTQVGAVAHGTFSLTIIDPILFALRYMPATYLQGLDVFDFTERTNPAAAQLFSEVVGSLASAFSAFLNQSGNGNRIARIQQDSIGFTRVLADTVQQAYQWQEARGLALSQVTIMGVEYDEQTRELLKTVQRADALMGTRGNVNLQASVAEGIQSAGQVGGASAILGLGVAAGSVGVSDLMQSQGSPGPDPGVAAGGQDLVATLETLKRALDAGLIEQSEYEAAKAKALGLS